MKKQNNEKGERVINLDQERDELYDIKWLQEIGLIAKAKKCEKCQKECNLKWRCRDKNAINRFIY